jgi:hypothetical protein
MGSYLVPILNHIMGIEPFLAYEWYIGLYTPGGEPKVDLAACEIAGTRVALVPDADLQPYDTTALTNNADITFLNLPAGAIAGWFVVNGLTEMDVSWSGGFSTYVNVGEGDSLVLGWNRVILQMNDGTTALPPDGGGGGGEG